MGQLGVNRRLHFQPSSFRPWSFVRKLICAEVVTYLYDQWVLIWKTSLEEQRSAGQGRVGWLSLIALKTAQNTLYLPPAAYKVLQHSSPLLCLLGSGKVCGVCVCVCVCCYCCFLCLFLWVWASICVFTHSQSDGTCLRMMETNVNEKVLCLFWLVSICISPRAHGASHLSACLHR